MTKCTFKLCGVKDRKKEKKFHGNLCEQTDIQTNP